MKPLRIFLYENDEALLNAVAHKIEQHFGKRAIKTDIVKVLVSSGSEDLRNEIEEVRPDVLIFDNHIGPMPNQAMFGQSKISALKPFFPDILFVLMTAEAFRKDAFYAHTPNPDLLVSKTGLLGSQDTYISWFVSEVSHRVRRARIAEIDTQECKSAFSNFKCREPGQKTNPITDVEVRSIIEQVCHTGGDISENVIEAVKVSPLEDSDGKSGAVLTAVRISNRYGKYRVQAVLKFLQKSETFREAHNHAKYVKWVLPYRWRVDLIGQGFTSRFGAVCYSFAHGGTGNPETLSKILKDANQISRIKRVMQAVFDPESQAWYSNQRRIEKQLPYYFSERAPYFSSQQDGAKREQSVLQLLTDLKVDSGVLLQQVPASNTAIVKIGEASLLVNVSEILSFVLSIREFPETVECLSHGDLNSGNILLRGNSEEFCFIDFQHTGWHHRAKDFCSMEGSIRTLQPQSKRTLSQRVVDDIAAWERCVKKEYMDEGDDALIDEIRRLYFLNHPTSPVKELAIASLIHTWWLLSFSDTWKEYQKHRLLCYFLATLWCLQKKDFFESGLSVQEQ